MGNGTAIRADAPRRRRLRSVPASAAAAITVLAVIGVTNVLTSSGTAGTVTIPGPEPTPVAMRLVGFGHAAIAVPKVWGTNFSRCGTPRKDTVLIDDPSAASDCQVARPKNVDSVELSRTPGPDFHADETFTIDGVRAERQRTVCLDGECRGAVGIPSFDIWFRAESSTNADEVDRTLARIEIVTDRIGVPSYQQLPDKPPTGAAYAKVLERARLRAELWTRTSFSNRVGQIFGVSPAPGTLLKPGATVTVTVIK